MWPPGSHQRASSITPRTAVSRGGRGGGVALGELPGTSEPVSPQVLAWKGSGGQTRRLQCPQAPRKAVNPTAAGSPGCSVHAVSLLCPSTLSRCQGNAYRTLVGTECSSEVHGAQGRPSRPSGRNQAGLCPMLSTGPGGCPQAGLCPRLSKGTGGHPQGSLRASVAVPRALHGHRPLCWILLASVLCPVRRTPPLSRHRPWGTFLCSFRRWGEH